MGTIELYFENLFPYLEERQKILSLLCDPFPKEHELYFWVGTGNNGRSILQRLIIRAFPNSTAGLGTTNPFSNISGLLPPHLKYIFLDELEDNQPLPSENPFNIPVIIQTNVLPHSNSTHILFNGAFNHQLPFEWESLVPAFREYILSERTKRIMIYHNEQQKSIKLFDILYYDADL